MKLSKAISAFGLAGCALFALGLSGCASDKSGDTQTMPDSAGASAPNPSPSVPSNVPESARSAISKAAPPPTGK